MTVPQPKQDDRLKDQINWEVLMNLPRAAGGHDLHMLSLIRGTELIAHYNEGDWQGLVSTCIKLPDGRVAIYLDYYGSCSGCDAWEDASDEEIEKLCIDLANGAYIFDTLDECLQWLDMVNDLDKKQIEYMPWDEIASNLAHEIRYGQEGSYNHENQ